MWQNVKEDKMRDFNLKKIWTLLILTVMLTGLLVISCSEEEDKSSPSDAIIKFTFHPDCPSVRVKVYIDLEYRDLIYTDGSYQYNIKSGTHSYSIRRATDNEVLWSGQVTVTKGVIQGVTLTCG